MAIGLRPIPSFLGLQDHTEQKGEKCCHSSRYLATAVVVKMKRLVSCNKYIYRRCRLQTHAQRGTWGHWDKHERSETPKTYQTRHWIAVSNIFNIIDVSRGSGSIGLMSIDSVIWLRLLAGLHRMRQNIAVLTKDMTYKDQSPLSKFGWYWYL